MKLKVGMYYLTRAGSFCGPIVKNKGWSGETFSGYVSSENNSEFYYANGGYLVGSDMLLAKPYNQTEFDLVCDLGKLGKALFGS